MATVHRATIEIGVGVVREVALKRMLPQLVDDKKTLDDFIREAKLAAQLNHPNIVRILELGRNGTTYFIAMELVRGHSLLQLLKLMAAGGGMAPVGIVVALLAELCDALDYASTATDAEGEAMEIVHRDLSPSNLIIDTEGHLKIIDFGVAKSTRGQFVTSSGLVKGKLGYMPLEALAGKPVDRRSDIFSVGVVAWELLTGRRLFNAANEYDVITKIRKGATIKPSEINDEVSPELDEIVMHALSKKRDERWPSAGVMKTALDTVRRIHRDGPREVNAWRESLVPRTELHGEDSTTMEHMSLREVLREATQPSLTATTRSAPPLEMDHYDDDEMIDDSPTQMNVVPRSSPSDSHFGLATEPHPTLLPHQLGADPYDALVRESRKSGSFVEATPPGRGSGNGIAPRDTIIGHESSLSREPEED
jgi:serine/threonine protein kinase